MPIGVPRIIYCWGEELPPQWTDIYNFIFRRRMVFLMQYLDDELCNQICGLLINIHMEDRSKELEKKEIEKSGIFKSANKGGKESSSNSVSSASLNDGKVGGPSQALFDKNDGKKLKKDKSMEDLLSSYGNATEDLAIDENYTLEQYTLQKITLEWLNWNAQFFDYSDEPYLFYLAEILSRDFTKDDTGQLFYNFNYAQTNKNASLNPKETIGIPFLASYSLARKGKEAEGTGKVEDPLAKKATTLDSLVSAILIKPIFDTKKFSGIKKNAFQEYWPFRSILNLANLITKDQNFNIKNLLPLVSNNKERYVHTSLKVRGPLLASQAKQGVGAPSKPVILNKEKQSNPFASLSPEVSVAKISVAKKNGKGNGRELLHQFNQLNQKPGLTKLLGVLASKEFGKKNTNSQKQQSVVTKVLGQRNLRKEYALDNNFNNYGSLTTTLLGGQSPLMSEYGLFTRSLVAQPPSCNALTRGEWKWSDAVSNSSANAAKATQDGERNGVTEQLPNSIIFPLLRNPFPSSVAAIRKGAAQQQERGSDVKGSSEIEQNALYSSQKQQKKKRALNYLDFDSAGAKQINKRGNKKSFSAATRKQTKRALQEEESKKVFVIINSFGGSVGNGITVHDALQFIKAGSLTLGLGVAASAASLVLAGGTISERYVTEGCHTMIHQPEGGLNGQASDIWIDSQEIMKIRLDVAEIYSLSAHRPRHKILRDLDRDFYLTATETIHYGLADEIATNDVMHEIIEMTSKVWDYHDSKQQRLLETRNSANTVDTQTQS